MPAIPKEDGIFEAVEIHLPKTTSIFGYLFLGCGFTPSFR